MFRRISLRVSVVLSFLVLFLLAVGVIGVLGYRAAAGSLERFERQMAAEVGKRILVHLEGVFSDLVLVVQMNAEAMDSGRLDPADSDQLGRQFVGQIRHLPHLTFVSFGRADGEYVGATRQPDNNEVRLMTALRSEGMTVDAYQVVPGNARGERIAQGKPFDARRRPWFEQAVAKGRLSWYPVYHYQPYDSLGLGVSAPVYDVADGTLRGVLAGDVALSRLGDYLRQQPLGASGLAFIAESDGTLLAISGNDAIVRAEGASIGRYALVDHEDPRLREAGQILRGLEQVGGQFFFSTGGERFLLDLRQFRDPHGLLVNVGVILAEEDFSGPFDRDVRRVAYLVLLVVLAVTFCVVLLTEWLTRPIRRLSDRARRLADGQWVEDWSETSRVAEIADLAGSFDVMAATLRNAFSDLEARVAERTSALESANIELERLAILDGLTQIANRRRFDAVLGEEWRRCQREHQSIGLLMVDVDHFKAYNDHYGHQAGDRVLIQVAACCQGEIRRSSDLAARYGGEEFAVILPNTEREGALRVAANIQQALRRAAIPHARSSLGGLVTLSFGVACVVPEPDSDADALLRAADNALYAAKRAGRNRIEYAREDGGNPPQAELPLN